MFISWKTNEHHHQQIMQRFVMPNLGIRNTCYAQLGHNNSPTNHATICYARLGLCQTTCCAMAVPTTAWGRGRLYQPPQAAPATNTRTPSPMPERHHQRPNVSSSPTSSSSIQKVSPSTSMYQQQPSSCVSSKKRLSSLVWLASSMASLLLSTITMSGTSRNTPARHRRRCRIRRG